MASVATVTVTATVASTAASAAATALRAAPQGGVLEGMDPSQYSASNPIILFIIQAGIIIIFCRLLHYPLSLIRQPRVIAEVIGGIILGPSVMMRIPGFQAAIFPTASMPILNLVANLGLILFLFLVALEVDMRLFMLNWRVALSVGFAGMMLPFGLGVAIAYGLYNQFREDSGLVPITFGVYAIFIGTAMSITAFPVLCRILTELNLLGTPVGVTVLAAGVGNDVVGWILLALCVALVNNASGLTALYVLLCCFGWILLLVFGIRPAFVWLLRRSGSIQNGPTQGMVAVTILLVLFSSWFTGIIGVHPIFGAFLVGLICPHDQGFAVKLTEKIEDLVVVIFLPLYFALSGLNTNLGLLNDGITWGYVVGVIAIAFSGKIIGGTLAARSCKLVWRESFTIGVLMSCKGLVELIVLNIGLQAKILSQRTFTIFVVMALVTTVSTTPLTTLLYPPWYQKKLEAWKRGEIDWDGNNLHEETSEVSLEKFHSSQVKRLLVYLRLESLSSLFTFIALLGDESPAPSPKVHKAKIGQHPAEEEGSSSRQYLQVSGIRMLPLTERTSSVMKVSESDEYAHRDPVVNAFRTFAQLNNIAVSGDMSIVPESTFASTLVSKASDFSSDLILIPWSETGIISEDETTFPSTESHSRFSNGPHTQFVREALDLAACNTAVFINHNFGGPRTNERGLQRALSGLSISNPAISVSPIADRSHHLFLPFLGGPDDRVALRFVLQLAHNVSITATILHLQVTSDGVSSKAPETTEASSGILGRFSKSQPSIPLSVPFVPATVTSSSDLAYLQTLRDSLPTALASRVVFESVQTSKPISMALKHVIAEVGQSPRNAGDLIVCGRGTEWGNEVVGDHREEEVGKVLGRWAEVCLERGMKASLLVMKAGGKAIDA